MDATPALLGVEPLGELGDEPLDRPAVAVRRVVLAGEGAQAREVGLPRDLLVGVGLGVRRVPERVGHGDHDVGHARGGRGPTEAGHDPPRPRPPQEGPSRTWYGTPAAANASSYGSERALIR